MQIEQGHFGEAWRLILKLAEIWKDYENALAEVNRQSLQAYWNAQYGNLDIAQTEVDACISFATESGIDVTEGLLGLKAIIQMP